MPIGSGGGGGNTEQLYQIENIVAPKANQAANGFQVFMYAYTGTSWQQSDFDFSVTLHDAPGSAGSSPYSKLPKTIQDSAVGFQTMNQAAVNEKAIHDAYIAEHVDLDLTTGGTNPLVKLGQHNTLLVPRWVGGFILQPQVNVNPSIIPTAMTSTKRFGGVTYISPGVYFLALTIDAQSFCEVTPTGPASMLGAQPYLSAARPGNQLTIPGFYILTWWQSSAGGTFAPADPTGFSAAVYSNS